jgi:hypothetical protein
MIRKCSAGASIIVIDPWMTKCTRAQSQIEFPLRSNSHENVHPVPTFVLSHSEPKRKPKRPGVVFTDGDTAAILERAKSVTDKAIWIEGGANVAQQFLKRDCLTGSSLASFRWFLATASNYSSQLSAASNSR